MCASLPMSERLEGLVGHWKLEGDCKDHSPAGNHGTNHNVDLISIKASSGGYNSQGNDKHIYFGIDNGREMSWEDCGRPDDNSNFVNSLTVYDGKLFAGTSSCSGSVLDAPCDVRGKVFCAKSGKCVSYDYDLSNEEPLKIGFGETDYFSGTMRDVRLYSRALTANELRHLYKETAQY